MIVNHTKQSSLTHALDTSSNLNQDKHNKMVPPCPTFRMECFLKWMTCAFVSHALTKRASNSSNHCISLYSVYNKVTVLNQVICHCTVCMLQVKQAKKYKCHMLSNTQRARTRLHACIYLWDIGMGSLGTAPFRKERPNQVEPTPQGKRGEATGNRGIPCNLVCGITPTCTCVQTHCHAKHECVSYLRYLRPGEKVNAPEAVPPDPK